MGNSDPHAKNLSFRYSESAKELAPFYDLTCTRAYHRLDRKLAMACGSEFDPDRITQKQLKEFCAQTSITLRFLNQSIKDVLGRLPDAMTKAEKDVLGQGFFKSDIQNVQQTVTKIQQHMTNQIFSF